MYLFSNTYTIPSLIVILFLTVVYLFYRVSYLHIQKQKLQLAFKLESQHLSTANKSIARSSEKIKAYEKEIDFLRNPTTFKLQPPSGDSQLIGFRCEKEVVKAFDEKCLVDGVKISRAAMLRFFIHNFVEFGKIHD